MKIFDKILLGLSAALLWSACDSYLEQPPSKSSGIRISTVEELEALLAYNNFNGKAPLDNNMASIVCGDCFDITVQYYDNGLKKLSTLPELYQLACWEMQHTQNTNEKVSMWKVNYESVYLANLVLTNVDQVTGSAEAKNTVRCKAHLLRAYNYLDLVQYYCMPYGASTLQEPGLPLKRTTGYEEPYERASLEDTYRFIEADVLEAVKLDAPLYENGERKAWRETGALANAVAARFYLLKGEYAEARKYAEAALRYDDTLLDFRDAANLSQGFTLSLLLGNLIAVPGWWNETNELGRYAAEKERAFYWKQNYYLAQNIWGIPSEKLLNAYDQSYDLRYRYFIIPQFQGVYFYGTYALSFTGNVPGYATFNHFFSTAPNVAEMRLIRAECLAREGAVDEAMRAVNEFRAFRMAGDTPSASLNLVASSQQEAVRMVLEERMREFPFTLRWNDVRRCNFNSDPDDNVTVTRRFYQVNAYGIDSGKEVVYELTPQSRTYAVALPSVEIVSGDGRIEQNRY